jgi:adenine-specific DNA-methyltransferase
MCIRDSNDKQGLPKALAYGIALFLNTTAVDEQFRTFNGHTQVNATDLRRIKYPGRDTLIALGEWALTQPELTQELMDARLAAVMT